MKKSDQNFFQKLFSNIGLGSSRVPLRSNIFRGAGGKGYSQIGQTGRSGLFNNGDRQSPLLGNAQPSNRLSGYYERVAELKGYQLLDITQTAVNFFKDYVINFITKSEQSIVTIINEDGSNNEQASERINECLTKDLDITNYIRNHIDDEIFYGTYGSMIRTFHDETGHTKFSFVELYDPVSTVIKKKRNSEGEIEEICLARGEDGSLYEIPEGEYFLMGSQDLRLINDLEDGWKDSKSGTNKVKYDRSNSQDEKNRDKVVRKESYIAGMPLFYSMVLKVKELVVKELLISLISLRDLATPTLFGLAIDKGVSMEAANDLCARMQKLTTNYTELNSFLSANFDSTSFIESVLTQNVKFFPDYNGTVSNKGPQTLDKLSEKYLELLQSLDQTRQSILGPIGIPSTIIDGSVSSGTKWSVLQTSERANSKVASIMSGIQNSISDLARVIYTKFYNEDIDPALIKVHIFEKSTVEYNNQINQSESVNGVVQGISNVLSSATQLMDSTLGLMDPEKFLSYIQNQIKDIDPGASEFITEESIQQYSQLYNAKLQAMMQQMDMGEDAGMM